MRGRRSEAPWALVGLLGLWSAAAGAGIHLEFSGPTRVRVVCEAGAEPPQYPGVESCLVGIPLEGEVRLEVVEAQPGGLLAVPESGELRAAQPPPQGPAYLSERGFVRRQRVVRLNFAPRRQADGSLRYYERVVADLYFGGGGGGTGPRDRWGEALYRRVVLNYAQAKHWRRPKVAAKAVQEGREQRFKLFIGEQGLYRVSGRDLQEAGADLAAIDPARLRLLYGGGRMLPQGIEDTFNAELEELPLVVEDGGDGRFDADDYVLFYGESVARWEQYSRERYIFRQNLYTEENLYWLALDGPVPGRRVQTRSGALLRGDPARPQSYRARVHQEPEEFILIQTYSINSGYDWYWEEFRGNARNFPTVVRRAAPGPVDIRARFFGWTDQPHGFEVRWNDEPIGEFHFEGPQPDTLEIQAPAGAREGINQVGLFHRDNHVTRLDWIELEFSRGFAARRGELIFDAPPLEEGKEGFEFALSGFAGERPRIFEFSGELSEIVDFEYDAEKGRVVFQDIPGERARRYIVAGPGRWRRPLRLVEDRPSRLRSPGNGAEYLLITHPDFRPAAERLAAWRAQDARFGPPLRTMVVDVEDIYDEFSGGLLDPAAIRNFIKYAFENWDPAPFFVTLMGDGSYDYKNNSNISRGNWIPAFQDGDSTYDEWYVRVAGADPLPDLAIGRLPVQSADEAEALVDKMLSYERRPEVGSWQTRTLLVADDLNNPSAPETIESFFLLDSEALAREQLPLDLDLKKLYIAQFPLEGRTKPRARDAFIRRFNEGELVLTYIGHGNPETLAHEQIFVLSRDQEAIDNGRRLPFLYTAASQVGVFDDPVRQSMPEVLLNRPDGGIIGAISATRVGFHPSNMNLARSFYQQMFRTGRQHLPVGLALMEAKQRVQALPSDRRNIQRYSLFGDAALRLARPRFGVELELPATLRALEEIRVAGRILDAQGRPAPGYEGEVLLQVFDSAVSSLLEGLNYEQPGAPLFRGRAPVHEGRFELRFRVPKDITYRGTRGHISAYAWSAAQPAAFGSVRGLELAGTAAGVPVDEEGPQISIGFKGRSGFVSGGVVGPRPVLQALLRDPSGINVTGETGHEIELRVDEEVFAVTDSFVNEEGSYQTGLLEVGLPQLEPGAHRLSLKAWDSFNNSARALVEIRVSAERDLGLSEVLFYPNPLRDSGHFTYVLSEPASSVRIRVYSLSGRLVDEIEGEGRPGYNQVAWAPPGDLASGSYLYRIAARGEDGKKVEKIAIIQVIK